MQSPLLPHPNSFFNFTLIWFLFSTLHWKCSCKSCQWTSYCQSQMMILCPHHPSSLYHSLLNKSSFLDFMITHAPGFLFQNDHSFLASFVRLSFSVKLVKFKDLQGLCLSSLFFLVLSFQRSFDPFSWL